LATVVLSLRLAKSPNLKASPEIPWRLLSCSDFVVLKQDWHIAYALFSGSGALRRLYLGQVGFVGEIFLYLFKYLKYRL
jgi:hypothetical protein